MNIFENAKTWTKQGDIGEARAIYELTALGYTLSKPLTDSSKYDLVIEKDGVLARVQVKTTTVHPRHNDNKWVVNLRTRGSNMGNLTRISREEDDYDYLFVMTCTGDCWLIPTEEFADSKANLHVGAGRFDEYKIA